MWRMLKCVCVGGGGREVGKVKYLHFLAYFEKLSRR